MEKDTVFWILFAVLAFLAIRQYLNRNRVKPDKYEYLEVMSYTKWKSGREIRIEMEKIKGGWIVQIEVYFAMRDLEEEGFVERRIRNIGEIKWHQFRKKPGGRRRRDEKRNDSLVISSNTQPA